VQGDLSMDSRRRGDISRNWEDCPSMLEQPIFECFIAKILKNMKIQL
jgi:hypothetical protein